MATLLELKEQGKIRAIGVSNATAAEMEQYRELGPLDSDQERYSLLDQHIAEEQLPYCQDHGIAVLAYSPLEQGLLTGKVTAERQFAKDRLDHCTAWRDPRSGWYTQRATSNRKCRCR